jgi:4a-hydroxytetrahydrobiopterin dehydratase
MTDTALSRTAASDAVESIGWRYLLAQLATSVAVPSLGEAGEVARAATIACGPDADLHLRADLRPDRVELTLQTRSIDALTDKDVRLAKLISAAIGELGHTTAGATSNYSGRPVQMVELGIDTMDMAAIRPFWKAVLAYADEADGGAEPNALVDPAGQLPPIWFQKMDVMRPDRNRIHFDVTVAHDEAEARVKAVLKAGGVMVNDASGPSFYVLADAEGNEACVCTWTERDERGW